MVKMTKTPKNNCFNTSYSILPDKYDMQPDSIPNTSKPVHVQRIEAALNLDNFVKSVDNQFLESSDSDSDDSATKNDIEDLLKESESYSHKDYFNFSQVSNNRKWLADILQEDIEIEEEASVKDLLRMHVYHKSVIKNSTANLNDYMYYGAGLLSNVDKYPEIEKTLPFKVTKKKVIKEEQSLYLPEVLDDISEDHCLDMNFDNGLDLHNIDEDDSNVNSDFSSSLHVATNSTTSTRKRAKKFKDEESKRKWEDLMTIKRKKVFTNLVKKEIGKQHRSKMNRHKEMLLQCKRVAQQCLKHARQKALMSARIVKEQQWRMKRLSRENIAYWKRSRRFDREVKKRMEKEAEEQRKIDHELVEAKRQQRKLNFLITQTELYAHFMSRKLGQVSPEEQIRILSQLDEEKNYRLTTIDEYDSESMKEKARRNAQEAFQTEKARTKHFDLEANSSLMEVDTYRDGEYPQPLIFEGKLKGYQLRGMNWLANLYAQGISGILADEMGLGKTVQSIAFLCHIAERYSVWGPFLIISPASTLHNWQQEIAKFVPEFKVVPYWGNPNERKILRQFWDQKDIYTKDASFHIVVTSYQIVITDIKYFNRIKWQYMILDEAQAIKSTSSMRWKTLLGFSCRNRLLLSGTPIQNSMAELWALLHFIMPTLFDSHEEFNEWFSKDIESHAENKTGIDEKHLSRLHMILKPFMLRRIKKDVENELSDKIEVMVYCPLTTRQKLLYLALKQKIKIEDLLHYTVGGGDSQTVDKNFTSNLMNLVMQFRKVCNHPELFERRDAKLPIGLASCVYVVPFLIYIFNTRAELYLKVRRFNIHNPEYISQAIKNHINETIFNFCIGLKLSFEDIYRIFIGDILHRWKTYYEFENEDYILYHRKFWSQTVSDVPSIRLRKDFKLCESSINTSNVLVDMVFTRKNMASRVIYTHTDHYFHSMPETVEHKNIRCKSLNVNNNTGNNDEETIIDVVNEEGITNEEAAGNEEAVNRSNHIPIADFVHRERPSQLFPCEQTEMPSFLFSSMPKICTSPISLYCYSRKAAWDLLRHKDEYSYRAINYYWSKATGIVPKTENAQYFYPEPVNGIDVLRCVNGWSYIAIPDKESLVTDSGKLSVLDSLLKRLKEEGHRVLIYSQMTKMIDLLEEYMWHRHHKYMRLDGSSKISERRDMVADFQARTDIFVFLLSTRAGGLGINLTAADTVIFYDSDWNPTVDQQAMDRAHRLGQTKQVTVYRLICKGSIEERILQRAREKSEIQKLVISGGNFKPDTLKPKEVVSLLLDDEELVQKYNLKVESGKTSDEKDSDKKRKLGMKAAAVVAPDTKKMKEEPNPQENRVEVQWTSVDSGPNSPRSLNSPDITADDINESGFIDDVDTSITNKYTVYNVYGSTVKPRLPVRGTSRRGRPRGSRRVNTPGRHNVSTSSANTGASFSASVEPLSGETSPASSTSSVISGNVLDPSTVCVTNFTPSCTVRRGPGRPRLKPGGPSNAGSRGTYRPRKPARPLPVPLPSDPNVPSTSTGSNATSLSYMYDFDVLYAKNQNDT